MNLQQHRIQEDTKCLNTCRMESICSCNVGDEGDDDDTANSASSSINVDNTETEDIDTVSSVIRVYDTDVSHQSKTDDFDLTKLLKRLFY